MKANTYYQKFATKYEIRHGIQKAGAAYFLDLFNTRATRYLEPGMEVLEIGAGTGFVTGILARHTTGVIASDRSFEMLLAGDGALAGRSRVCAEVEELPFADGSFDVVVSNNSFYLFADKPRAAKEISRVLRPDGTCLLSEMNPFQPLWPFRIIANGRFFERGLYEIFPHQLNRMFANAGMRPERIDFYCSAPYFADHNTISLYAGLESVAQRFGVLKRILTFRMFLALSKNRPDDR